MNHAWDDLPRELQYPLYELVISNPRVAGGDIVEYMWDHHACYYANAGSRVNSCDSLALPGSDYCARHGNFD